MDFTVKRPNFLSVACLGRVFFAICIFWAAVFFLHDNAVFAQEIRQVQAEFVSVKPIALSEPAGEVVDAKVISGDEISETSVSLNIDKKGQKKLISLDLKGVNIIELLRIISMKTGLTIIPSKGVAGKVNIFLNNIKISDVLDIILSSQNLACEKRGDLLYVMTDVEYKKMYGVEYIDKRVYASMKLVYADPENVFKAISQLKSDIGSVIIDKASGTVVLLDIPDKVEVMTQTVKQLDCSLETIVFDLNYATPEDVEKRLIKVITPVTGSVIIDARSSKIIVSDLPSKMDEVKKIIADLDSPEKQVFIEAEIVQVNLNGAFSRGINWERIFTEHDLDGLDLISQFPITPAVSASGKVSIGTIAGDNYNAILEFIERKGNLKILSRPRIAVTNNTEAKIMVGKRDVYVTQTMSQGDTSTITAENVEFIDVGVKLNVTPVINEEGFILMKIKPEVSSVSETITTSLGSRIPILETSEAETMVKVKDGTMIMIAGLMREEKRNEHAGLPILSRIPFVSSFFSSQNDRNLKTELIVFIRPHIMTGEFSLEGTGPEKFIPQELMPEDIKNYIVQQEIEKIRPLPGCNHKQNVYERDVSLDVGAKIESLKFP
ncbi:MAG: hypothetical protein DRP78_04860 [Candidatus Omnitrophota bacterium]|nr:MAG: hypothetical protein DRP78_04860 [Candidatus Omnitrophota bacterium]